MDCVSTQTRIQLWRGNFDYYINDDTIRHTLVVVHDGTKVEGFELT